MLGSIDPQRPILIIGAGISGLSLGFRLKRLGLNYRIIESSHRTGGKLGTQLLPQGIAEQAANALLTSDQLQVLWRELNLEPLLPKKKSLNRWILSPQGEWISARYLLILMAKDLLTRGFKSQGAITHLTLGEWARGFLSPKTCHYFLTLFKGIYGQEGEQLGLQTIFDPLFLEQEENKLLCGAAPPSYFGWFYHYWRYMKNKTPSSRPSHYRGSISFKGGMQQLIDALTADQQEVLELSCSPERLQQLTSEPNQQLVFCTPPQVTADLLDQIKSQVKSITPTKAQAYEQMALLLRQFTARDLQSTTLFFTQPILRLKNSFGVLVGADEALLGVLANSEIFEHRVTRPELHSYTFISHPLEMETLYQLIKKYFFPNDNFLPLEGSGITSCWPKAIVTFGPQQREIVKRMAELISQSQVMLHGPYLQHIGLRSLIEASLQC
jgi:protoporphyrinogen/coproporphyrinogen III oxidase